MPNRISSQPLPARFEGIRALIVSRLPGRARTLVGGLLLFALSVALFAAIQYATPGLVGIDGYYHVKMAYLMRRDGLTPLFVWLPLSILNPASFYDHHMLYHVYLALFVPLRLANATPEALTQGAKLASVVMPGLVVLAVWWQLRGQGVRWAGLWAAGLFAVSDGFLYRMSMPRAQAASLLVLVVGLGWLLQRRYRLLVPLAFAYVWLYNAFPLLMVVAVVAVAGTWLAERRLEWQPLAAVGAGTLLGLLVNPYFPADVAFLLNHVIPKLGDVGSRVGNEWFPYQTWTLVENSTGALLAAAAGVLALAWDEKRINRAPLVALLLVMAFGAMLMKSRRFVEYFPAFALIFAALTVPRLSEALASRRARALAALALVLAAAALGVRHVTRARDAVANSKPADLYADAASWLAENSPPGSMVFQTDWDDFPRLFFYDTSNTYTIGLDVTYMQLYSEDLYNLWADVTRGRVDQPGEIIASAFGARYVFSDLDHEAFVARAEEDPRLREVYRDEEAVIYEVLP